MRPISVHQRSTVGAANEGQPQFAASRMGVGPLHSIDEVAEGNEALEKRERQEGITPGAGEGPDTALAILAAERRACERSGQTIGPPRVLSEEPTAVTPHGGICGGESQQWLSYPTNLHVRFDERGVETEPRLSH
jgi:hypothetical protein